MDEKEVRRIVETYSDMILRISYNYLQHTFDSMAQEIIEAK
ncbi:hypothetical protein [Pseudobutyrivibrio xylanivorans]|uniref:RNA polymerase sigma-70 factor, ECF subfamily n=1 Tax=Pseudobutyrivibrio xylanivorans DSM 14809 TaxID=1123012 RepID=A0A1M6JCE1_PSEXY|nr:hypothetical protein [Pseudobutyrivibrio xylanivorans]SHJ44300.1 RNA polymerase sigma-70 factor, ECF subfamily [Pseudobutyrivibrio xylanivorans DSM 14809]